MHSVQLCTLKFNYIKIRSPLIKILLNISNNFAFVYKICNIFISVQYNII